MRPNNAKLFGVHPSGKARTWEETVSLKGGASKVRSKTFHGIAKAMATQWASIHSEQGGCDICRMQDIVSNAHI